MGISIQECIKTVKIIEDSIEVTFADSKTIKFEDCWLRDQCRCSSCFDTTLHQRSKHISDLPDAKVIEVEYDTTEVQLKWADDHKSVYTFEFLSQFEYKRWSEARRIKPILWHGEEVADKMAKVHVKEFIELEDGARLVYQSLLDYGVALIEGVEPTMEATEEISKAMGGIQHTVYGGMWCLTPKEGPADLAFSSNPMSVHNDGTFFIESPGLQIFHCLLEAEGGETILVDGFYGATRLKEEHPEDYKFLTKINLETEFRKYGHHLRHSAPVIRIDDIGDIKQIRYKINDRAPMAFNSSGECRSYYRSLKNLARYYEDRENQWQIKLKPGTVIIIDNYRVLHGRTGFKGDRMLVGNYVTSSGWLDKARVLRLVH